MKIDQDVTATLDRLEAQFGRETLAELLNALARQLEEALAALDRGEAQAIAHRVAGTAGILGFADPGRAWQTLSEGEAAPLVREQALAALAIIADRTQCAARPTTSV